MKALFKILLQTSNKAILVITNNLDKDISAPEIVYANPKFLDKTGYDIEEIKDKSPIILLSNQNDIITLYEIKKQITTKNIWNGCLEIKNKDSSITPVDFQIHPIMDAEEHIIYYICIANKINENPVCGLDNFADNVFCQQDYLRDLSSNITTAMWKADTNKIVQFSNMACRSNFSLSKNKHLDEIVFEDDCGFFNKAIDIALESKQKKKVSFRLKDNAERWCECVIDVSFDKEGNVSGLVGTLKDATEQHKFIEQLQTLRTLRV